MSEESNKGHRPRGKSSRGNFQTAKDFATASEDARVAADKKKTEALRQARLKREKDVGQAAKAKASP